MAHAAQGAALVWCFNDPTPQVAVIALSRIANHGSTAFVHPKPKTVIQAHWGKASNKKLYEVMVLEVENGLTATATKSLNDKLVEFGQLIYSNLGKDYVKESSSDKQELVSTVPEEDDENSQADSMEHGLKASKTVEKGIKRVNVEAVIESAVKKLKAEIKMDSDESEKTHDMEHETLFFDVTKLRNDMEKLQNENKLFSERLSKLENKPAPTAVQGSRGFVYTESENDVAQARQAALLYEAVKHKDTFGKAVSEACNEYLFNKEELLTCVVSDPSRSNVPNKSRLDPKKVLLIREMVKIYAMKKGQTGKEAPKPGDVTEAIGQVLAYAKRKEAKEAQKAEAAPID